MSDKKGEVLAIHSAELEIIPCDKADCTFVASATTLKSARAAISEHKTYHDKVLTK